MKAKGEVEETHHTSRSDFGKHKARMLFLFGTESDMLQNTKAWHIPSSRGKTGTTQKRNLSLALGQAEQAPECQEQAWKGGGTEQHEGAFLTLAALWRGAEGCEGSMWDWEAPRILQRAARSCCSPSHTPAPMLLLHRQWVCSPKNQNSFDLQFFSLSFSLNYTYLP